ncbi:hypothetical protein L6452_30389 [Arctium lappa]|uniref:Uncharacterized protein n=1 Tax=Arctium lappa TaxID=4217 RepID=A0ACB8ZI40_ARCLA|nr:hypothetical protein L6452_30389 [Arctium lappa]
MAATSSFKAISMILVVIAAVLSASAVSAQDFGMAPAAAPTGMDSGSGYSVPVSGLILCASMIVSALALIKH